MGRSRVRIVETATPSRARSNRSPNQTPTSPSPSFVNYVLRGARGQGPRCIGRRIDRTGPSVYPGRIIPGLRAGRW